MIRDISENIAVDCSDQLVVKMSRIRVGADIVVDLQGKLILVEVA